MTRTKSFDSALRLVATVTSRTSLSLRLCRAKQMAEKGSLSAARSAPSQVLAGDDQVAPMLVATVEGQIQDRARPPVTPAQPNIPQIVLLGLFGGLGLGIGLASLLELIDSTVRNEEEFAHRYPDLPILGSIPNLYADTTAPGKFIGGNMRPNTATGGRRG